MASSLSSSSRLGLSPPCAPFIHQKRIYLLDLDVCIYAPTVYTVNVHIGDDIAYIYLCLSVPVILKAQISNLKAFFVCDVKVILGSVTRWIYFFKA
jgi:hypothetical protein